MTPPTSPRRGAVTSGDVLLALSALALAAALAYPRVERALMWRSAASAQADVEAVRDAATAYFRQTGAWPAPAEAGVVPAELSGRLPPDFSFRRSHYTLAWSRWESPELPKTPAEAAAPPEPDLLPPTSADSIPEVQIPVLTMGAITVSTADERILAALLDRRGPGRSFVREGSWTLVLLPGGEDQPPGPKR